MPEERAARPGEFQPGAQWIPWPGERARSASRCSVTRRIRSAEARAPLITPMSCWSRSRRSLWITAAPAVWRLAPGPALRLIAADPGPGRKEGRRWPGRRVDSGALPPDCRPHRAGGCAPVVLPSASRRWRRTPPRLPSTPSPRSRGFSSRRSFRRQGRQRFLAFTEDFFEGGNLLLMLRGPRPLRQPGPEDRAVGDEPLDDVESEQRLDGGAERLAAGFFFRERADLLGVEEEQLRNVERKEVLDQLRPIVREPLVGHTVLEDPQFLAYSPVEILPGAADVVKVSHG